MEKMASARAQRRSKTNKARKQRGESDRAKSARLEELLRASRNHSNLSLSKGMMDLGTFCCFCFVWQSLSRLGWP